MPPNPIPNRYRSRCRHRYRHRYRFEKIGKEKDDIDIDYDVDHDGEGKKRVESGFGHEKLDVYRVAIEYVGWVHHYCEQLNGCRNAKDQLIRASQAIPLNIAEGNGKATDGDRRRYFEIARGSAFECGAAQDVLQACEAMKPEENVRMKETLQRIVAMLTKLGGRGYSVHEEPADLLN